MTDKTAETAEDMIIMPNDKYSFTLRDKLEFALMALVLSVVYFAQSQGAYQ